MDEKDFDDVKAGPFALSLGCMQHARKKMAGENNDFNIHLRSFARHLHYLSSQQCLRINTEALPPSKVSLRLYAMLYQNRRLVAYVLLTWKFNQCLKTLTMSNVIARRAAYSTPKSPFSHEFEICFTHQEVVQLFRPQKIQDAAPGEGTCPSLGVWVRHFEPKILFLVSGKILVTLRYCFELQGGEVFSANDGQILITHYNQPSLYARLRSILGRLDISPIIMSQWLHFATLPHVLRTIFTGDKMCVICKSALTYHDLCAQCQETHDLEAKAEAQAQALLAELEAEGAMSKKPGPQGQSKNAKRRAANAAAKVKANAAHAAAQARKAATQAAAKAALRVRRNSTCEAPQKQVATERPPSNSTCAKYAAPVEPDEENDENLCIVCLDSPRTHITVPCGHLKYCVNCADHIQEVLKLCPFCNGPITMMMKVFK
jgi:hypothetical protein